MEIATMSIHLVSSTLTSCTNAVRLCSLVEIAEILEGLINLTSDYFKLKLFDMNKLMLLMVLLISTKLQAQVDTSSWKTGKDSIIFCCFNATLSFENTVDTIACIILVVDSNDFVRRIHGYKIIHRGNYYEWNLDNDVYLYKDKTPIKKEDVIW